MSGNASGNKTLSLDEQLNHLKSEAETLLKSATDTAAVEAIKVRFLGRKGEITAVLRSLKDLPGDERGRIGALANTIQDGLSELVDEKLNTLNFAAIEEKISAEKIDVSMPGSYHAAGVPHPLTLITDEVCQIFLGMGFSTIDDHLCPEVETDYYNFDALNFPADHPARDMQDTFYTGVAPNVLLRSQTSNQQIRFMENNRPPIRVVSPGRVYRNEDVSSKKNVLFHQLEGLLVDEGVTLADLKGVLQAFLNQLFGEESQTRFRTSFFPFTEPSIEVDVLFRRTVNGVLKEDWLEIMGAGMVDPNVLENVGIDSEKYTGFAFGMGIERLAMLRYGITNIRAFYNNDLRFLKQFKG